jgi:8-oxo-dGTP diphosphatase/2-hydroxy-dATP diphosphatase
MDHAALYFNRELKEESGLTVPGNMDHVGILMFEFVDNPILMEVHVFRTHTFDGLLMETEEMLPRWYTHESIPYDSMWPDDKLWYPMMLSGKYFNGYFKFEGMDNLLQYTIEEVS